MLLKRKSEKVERLKKVALFSDLSQRQLERVARVVDEVRVEHGRVVTRQGDLGWECFLILRGRARVERNRKLIDRLGAGDSFGEMSLIDHEPRSASVVADTDMTLLVVDSRHFAALLEDVPALSRKLLVSLCARLRTADEELAKRN